MHQFTVPQFIDVENKIIGPITTRQFVTLLSAAVVIAIFYKIFDFSLFVTAGLGVLAIASCFAFVKINGRPFHFFVLNIVQTLRRPRLRVWNNRLLAIEHTQKIDLKIGEAKPLPKEYYKKSRLAEIALVVDTKGRYRGE